MQLHQIPWSVFKLLCDEKGIHFFHIAGDTATKSYDIYATNHLHYWWTTVSGTGTGEPGKVFEDDYKNASPAKSTAVASMGEFLAKATPPMNKDFVQKVELVARRGGAGFKQYTKASHNFCDKTTWWQQYDTYTDQAMEPDTPSVYTVYKLTTPRNTWINIDDFGIALQKYNAGSPNYGMVDVWERDGTLVGKAAWRPVIKKNGTALTSGYTINYATQKVTFDPALTSGDTVTASFRSVKTSGGSEFVTRPMANKKHLIPHIEINASLDLVMTTSAIFQIWAGDNAYSFGGADWYLQYEMDYESVKQLIALSTGRTTLIKAFGGTNAVPASADTGWSTNQKRGISCDYQEILFDFGIPGDFGQVIELRQADYAVLRVLLQGDIPFTGEYCSASMYIEEEPQ